MNWKPCSCRSTAVSSPPDDRAFGLAQTSLDELARMRESVSSGKGVPTANGLIAKIHALVSGTPATGVPAAPPPAPPVALAAVPHPRLHPLQRPPWLRPRQ